MIIYQNFSISRVRIQYVSKIVVWLRPNWLKVVSRISSVKDLQDNLAIRRRDNLSIFVNLRGSPFWISKQNWWSLKFRRIDSKIKKEWVQFLSKIHLILKTRLLNLNLKVSVEVLIIGNKMKKKGKGSYIKHIRVWLMGSIKKRPLTNQYKAYLLKRYLIWITLC